MEAVEEVDSDWAVSWLLMWLAVRPFSDVPAHMWSMHSERTIKTQVCNKQTKKSKIKWKCYWYKKAQSVSWAIWHLLKLQLELPTLERKLVRGKLKSKTILWWGRFELVRKDTADILEQLSTISALIINSTFKKVVSDHTRFLTK